MDAGVAVSAATTVVSTDSVQIADVLPGDSDLVESPASEITIAYPTDGEVEAAEDAGMTAPDYSSAQRFKWQLPNPEMLSIARPGGITKEEVDSTSRKVEESLSQFGIDVSVDQVRQGPTVTMYGLSPGWKGRSEEKSGQRVRVDTILNREKDIALALASPNLRFEAPVPGESVVGIEVPNTHPTEVTLRSVMATPFAHAAHARGRFDRVGQECLHQRNYHRVDHDEDAARTTADHDRPEASGANSLPGYPASVPPCDC
jgi:S-DNA-T family DNA segregation ATPase FtsK/SpoIIIE